MTETNSIYKVGDKVRIIAQTEGDCTSDAKIGGIAEILKEFDGMHYRVRYEAMDGDSPTGWILPESIEKVADKPTKNQRISALEAQVAELKAEVEALKQAQGKAGKLRILAVDPSITNVAPIPTPNELRKAIIAEARAFVAETTVKMNNGENETEGNATYRYYSTIPKFHVNSEKRAVTVLVRGEASGRIREKAIAKCAPGDVFNADIGKAIALGRALGLDVSKFEQAVQPTEVVVGMKTECKNGTRTVKKVVDLPYSTLCSGEKVSGQAFYSKEYGGWLAQSQVVITDDTEAQYE